MKHIFLLLLVLIGSIQVGYTGQPNRVEFLNSGKIIPEGFPLSEAVQVDNTLYLSGLVGILPGTLDYAPGGIKGQTEQTMKNIKTVLEAHGYSLNNLIKCTVLLADIEEWPAFNDVYKTFFTDHYPARAAYSVAGLAFGARVEIECIAAK